MNATQDLRLVQARDAQGMPYTAVDKIYRRDTNGILAINVNEILFYDGFSSHSHHLEKLVPPPPLGVWRHEDTLALRTKYLEHSRPVKSGQDVLNAASSLAELQDFPPPDIRSGLIHEMPYGVDKHHHGLHQLLSKGFERLGMLSAVKILDAYGQDNKEDTLRTAFDDAPRAAVHGDAHPLNLRLLPDETLMAVDWVRFTKGPLGEDLMRFFCPAALFMLPNMTWNTFRSFEEKTVLRYLDSLDCTPETREKIKNSIAASRIRCAAALAGHAADVHRAYPERRPLIEAFYTDIADQIIQA